MSYLEHPLTLISLRAYAASRKARGLSGGTLGAVQKAIKTRRITLVDGKVDPVTADAGWSRNTSVEQQQRGRSGGVKRVVVKAATAVGKTELPVDPEAADAAPEDYLAARARKEAALADLAEMQAAELRGETAKVDEVRDCWGEMVGAVRARFLSLPSMAAPQIAAPGKIPEVQAMLRKIINEALEELSGDGVPESAKKRARGHAENPTAAA